MTMNSHVQTVVQLGTNMVESVDSGIHNAPTYTALTKSNVFPKILKENLDYPLTGTTVVTSLSEWERVYEQLSRDFVEVPILGLDCEWISLRGSSKTKPIALIQLASHQGICALVRVCQLPKIPHTLKNILSNPNILKVGVATLEDGSKLKEDFGIQFCGGYDVRHLIQKHPNAKKLSVRPGLAGLSQHLLGTVLSKSSKVRCGNWEAKELSRNQIHYAAQDALASIAVCLKLIAETSTNDLNLWSSRNEFYRSWTETCDAKDAQFKISKNIRVTGSRQRRRQRPAVKQNKREKRPRIGKQKPAPTKSKTKFALTKRLTTQK